MKSGARAFNSCTYNCSSECLRPARDLIRYCADNDGPSNPAPTDPQCFESMKGYFNQRGNTSRDQDINDAIAFCAVRGATVTCANSTKTFLNNRSNTTREQDINDGANFCKKRGDVSCLQPTYDIYRQRSGTTKDQDINDTINACQR